MTRAHQSAEQGADGVQGVAHPALGVGGGGHALMQQVCEWKRTQLNMRSRVLQPNIRGHEVRRSQENRDRSAR